MNFKSRLNACFFQWGIAVVGVAAATQPLVAVDPAIQVDSSGNVGIGTSTPNNRLDVKSTDSYVSFRLSAAGASPNTAATMTFTDGGADGEFRMNIVDGDGPEFRVLANGNAIIAGGLISTGGGGACTEGDPCDGVFTPRYHVESIEDHAAFMWNNNYLEGVGPTAENGPIDITQKTGGLINELEKAHIYIERLNEEVKRQKDAMAEKDHRLADLETRLARIEALLTSRQ